MPGRGNGRGRGRGGFGGYNRNPRFNNGSQNSNRGGRPRFGGRGRGSRGGPGNVSGAWVRSLIRTSVINRDPARFSHLKMHVASDALAFKAFSFPFAQENLATASIATRFRVLAAQRAANINGLGQPTAKKTWDFLRSYHGAVSVAVSDTFDIGAPVQVWEDPTIAAQHPQSYNGAIGAASGSALSAVLGTRGVDAATGY